MEKQPRQAVLPLIMSLVLMLAPMVPFLAAQPAQAQETPPSQDQAVQIDSSNTFTAALKGDGTVWAWGMNDLGQLAGYTEASSNAPVRIIGGAEAPYIQQIAVGGTFGAALDTDGHVWVWGTIGSETYDEPLVFETDDKTVISIKAGETFLVALTAEEDGGLVYT